MLVVLLILAAALAAPTVSYSYQGYAPVNGELFVTTHTGADIAVYVPAGVQVQGQPQLQVFPGFWAGGTVYAHKRKIILTESAGSSRTAEYANLTLAHNGELRSDCKDLLLTDGTGRILPYTRWLCNSTHVGVTITANITYSYPMAVTGSGSVFVSPGTPAIIAFESWCDNRQTNLNLTVRSVVSPLCSYSLDGGTPVTVDVQPLSQNILGLGTLPAGHHSIELDCSTGSFELLTGSGSSVIFSAGGGVPVGSIEVGGGGCEAGVYALYGNQNDAADKSTGIVGGFTQTYDSGWKGATGNWVCNREGGGRWCTDRCTVGPMGYNIAFPDAPEGLIPLKIEGQFNGRWDCYAGGSAYSGTAYRCFGSSCVTDGFSGSWMNSGSVIQAPGLGAYNSSAKAASLGYQIVCEPGKGCCDTINAYPPSARLYGSQPLGVVYGGEEDSGLHVSLVGDREIAVLNGIASVPLKEGTNTFRVSGDDTDVLVRSLVQAHRDGSSMMSGTFGSRVVWGGTVENGLVDTRLVIGAPNGNFSAWRGAVPLSARYVSGEGWVLENVTGNVSFNFTASPLDVTLSSVMAPKLTFERNGVPQSSTVRGCFGGVCYLSYDFSTLRDVAATGVLNQDDLVVARLQVRRTGVPLSGVSCSGNLEANTTENGECTVMSTVDSGGQWEAGFVAIGSDWSGGRAGRMFNVSRLNVTLHIQTNGSPGLWHFTGTATRDGRIVNGTVNVLLSSGSSTVVHANADLTNGIFQGDITVPAGRYKTRVIVIDPPEEEQIWGTYEGDVYACFAAGAHCSLSWECCGGTCCSGMCASSCTAYQGSGSPSGGAPSGSGWSLPPTFEVQSNPLLAELLLRLYRARQWGQSPELEQLSSLGQVAVLENNETIIETVISEIDVYIQHKEAEEWALLEGVTANCSLRETDRSALRAILLEFLGSAIELDEWRDAVASVQHACLTPAAPTPPPRVVFEMLAGETKEKQNSYPEPQREVSSFKLPDPLLYVLNLPLALVVALGIATFRYVQYWK